MNNSDYCNTNGVNLFYEKRGEGRPILLLHGNGETHSIFDKLAEKLSKSYTIFMPDSRGHGKSSSTKKLDYALMAEDIVGFIEELGIQKPILYGFSDGGIIGLIIAIKHPDLLSRLVISGANIAPNGMKILYRVLFGIIFIFTWSRLHRLMLTQPHIEKSALKRIKIPVLVTVGQHDMIRDKHTRLIADEIPGCELKVFKGENHGSYIIGSDKMSEIINSFCDRKIKRDFQ